MRQARRKLEVLDAATLRARLVDSAVSGDSIGEHPALFDRHTAWLFAVDILPRFRGNERGKGMPAVAGGDKNGVDVVSPENGLHVPVEHAIGVPVVFVDHLLDPFAAAALQVGVGDHLHIGVEQEPREVLSASIADSDAAESDSFTRRHSAVFSERASRNPLWNCGGRTGNRHTFQEAASRKRL